MSMLEIAHDVIRRGRRSVLEPGRIRVPAPAAIAIVGVNGSGKSSLFMQLTDTLRGGRSRAVLTLADRTPSLAYVPQSPALPDWVHVPQLATSFGLEWSQLVSQMPQLLLHELPAERIGRLSTGQRQALAIALALGRTAAVTLLDEPFAALDFRRRVGALQLLREHRAAGRSIVLSSQSASDLAGLCDHFLVIRDGRYIFNGPVSALAPAASADAIESRLLELLV